MQSGRWVPQYCGNILPPTSERTCALILYLWKALTTYNKARFYLCENAYYNWHIFFTINTTNKFTEALLAANKRANEETILIMLSMYSKYRSYPSVFYNLVHAIIISITNFFLLQDTFLKFPTYFNLRRRQQAKITQYIKGSKWIFVFLKDSSSLKKYSVIMICNDT